MGGRQAKTMAREASRKVVVMRKVGRKKASKNAFSRPVFPSSVSALKCFSTLDLAIMTREADMERSSLWPPLNQMKNMKTNW